MAVARFGSVALDCDEPGPLAAFDEPPTWPDGRIPKQIHIDVAVDDLDASEAEAIHLGARRATEQPAPDRWRVLVDPAGHPFCLSTQIPE